ncbi:MAG: penicillin acylase family protein [Candidatus Thorarchaeota archaeon]
MKNNATMKFLFSLIGPIAMIVILTMPIGPLTGGLGILQPIGGIFDVGRGVDQLSDQTMVVQGIDSEIYIVIDEWGIPHIYASSLYDAFTGLGYMQAKDRLFQMVMQTYLAAGRISEVVGDMAIGTDMFHRTLGLRKSAVASYEWYLANENSNEDVAFALEANRGMTNGINQFIRSMTSADTPIEFKILGYTPDLWQEINAFIWAKYMTWGLSGGIMDLQRQLMRTQLDNDTLYHDMIQATWPYTVAIVQEQYNLSIVEYPMAPGGGPAAIEVESIVTEENFEDLITLPEYEPLMEVFNNMVKAFGEEDFVGSNSWAINGSKSATGRAILANDPHLSLQAPSLWYEAQIVIPGIMNVQGGTLPGTPGVLIGHTENMAWGMTNMGADFVDLFVEDLNPSNSSEYMYGEDWVPFSIVEEPIQTSSGQIIDFSVRWSVHGPCIDEILGETYGLANIAMNWTGNGITHEILALGLLNRANNLQDYFDALYWWDGPPHNFIYADTEGNIAVTVAGKMPLRSGYSGKYPVSGADPDVGIVGFVPYAYNPRSVNPTSGYIQTANQLSIDPDDIWYNILGPQAEGYRGRRINEWLFAQTSIDAQDFMSLQADVHDISARQMLPFVLDAWEAMGDGDTEIQEIVDILEDWNYYMETNLTAPTIWVYLLDSMKVAIFDELSSAGVSLRYAFTPVLEWILRENITYYLDDQTTSGVESMYEILRDALELANDEIRDDLGNNVTEWEYGLHHTILIDHLAGMTFIGGEGHRGSKYTVNVAGGWTVQHGPSRRMIADFDATPKFYTVYPGGQSQVMFSKHWEDLFDLWYTYDPISRRYGYCEEHYIASVEDFDEANEGTIIIEYRITLIPEVVI